MIDKNIAIPLQNLYLLKIFLRNTFWIDCLRPEPGSQYISVCCVGGLSIFSVIAEQRNAMFDLLSLSDQNQI